MPDLPEFRLKARWVLPMNGPAIRGGIVEIVGDRIAAIHDRPDADAIDLGPVAILPGLVNAHTHLEFSHLREPLRPPRPFADWIRSVVQERQGRTEPVVASLRQGERECVETGTSGLGEIATSDQDLAETMGRLSGVVFREVLGLGEERVAGQLDVARRHLAAEVSAEARITRGLSPHAPYSVHRELLEGCIDLACETQATVAMHVAETREELAFLERGSGPLADFLTAMGAWHRSGAADRLQIPDVLRSLSRAARALVVHGNYLEEGSLQFLVGQPQMSLIYCPRTHRYFGHDEYPLSRALELGINVALGTDSRASNPDLDVWQEARLVAKLFPDLSGEQVVRMATTNGAQALGVSASEGELAAGRFANLIVTDCDDSKADPYRCVLSGLRERVLGVMRMGEWVNPEWQVERRCN